MAIPIINSQYPNVIVGPRPRYHCRIRQDLRKHRTVAHTRRPPRNLWPRPEHRTMVASNFHHFQGTLVRLSRYGRALNPQSQRLHINSDGNSTSNRIFTREHRGQPLPKQGTAFDLGIQSHLNRLASALSADFSAGQYQYLPNIFTSSAIDQKPRPYGYPMTRCTNYGELVNSSTGDSLITHEAIRLVKSRRNEKHDDLRSTQGPLVLPKREEILAQGSTNTGTKIDESTTSSVDLQI